MKEISLAGLNAATKYPSIETYHVMDKGTLTEKLSFDFSGEGEISIREKIDGTNVRIIKMPGDDYFIGSREHLLHAKGDRVHNLTESIVEHTVPVAERLSSITSGYIHVFYLEMYGGKVGPNAKQYTGTGAVGHRLFDVALVRPEVIERPVETISHWRKQDGQAFFTDATLRRCAESEKLDLAPSLGIVSGNAVPFTVEGMHEWLQDHALQSTAWLDSGGEGNAEGVVLRTPNRSKIAKARVADYTKTMKKR